MSKRVVNKIVAFTLIIATVVFFQGTGNSYADIPKSYHAESNHIKCCS